MPSNHLILCRPLLLLPSVFLSIRVFSNESVLRIRWPKDWSFSFSISPSSEYSGLISIRIDGYYRTTDGAGPELESRSIWHQSPASKKQGTGCLREDTLGDGETRQRAWRLESSKAHVTVWLRTDFTQPMSESRQWPPPAENLSAQHILSSQWMFVKLNDNNGIIGITIIIIIHYVFCIRGAWWITVHKVAKSQTQLKKLSMHTHTIISYNIY